MQRIKTHSIVTLINLIFFSSSLLAGTSTSTFLVTATVGSSCSVSIPAMGFGGYVPTGPNMDCTSSMTVTCTNGAPFNVGLNAGMAPGATVATRAMQNGSNLLAYAIFQDSTRLINWGNTIGTDTLFLTGTGSAQTINMYGRVPGAQILVPAGSYSDTITTTVTF